jgi:four helix bundle protein
MFDFQKLLVYTKTKSFNKLVYSFLLSTKLDRTTKDQLKRASFSIMLNIAEGSSRLSNKDRRHFLTITRGSSFECVAIFEHLADIEVINESCYQQYYSQLEEISKMLFALIWKLGS